MTDGTATIQPTPERYRHAVLASGPISISSEQVMDSNGNAGAPFNAPDSLEVLYRRGVITQHMLNAGRDFRNDFEVAGMQRLHAAPLEECAKGHHDFTAHQLDARFRLNEALTLLGGLSSPAGCVCWYVLGVGLTLSDWAKREGWGGRSINRMAASGVLIGALGMLRAHYGYGEERA